MSSSIVELVQRSLEHVAEPLLAIGAVRHSRGDRAELREHLLLDESRRGLDAELLDAALRETTQERARLGLERRESGGIARRGLVRIARPLWRVAHRVELREGHDERSGRVL